MEFDGKLSIALGRSFESRIWKNTTTLWSDFVKKIKDNTVTNETYAEFMAASKKEQSSIKDVGGYVGGYLRNGRRKPGNVVFKQLLTLDIDFAHENFWADFCMQYEVAAVLHATHKHSPESPRYRLLIPLSREVTPDEYVAIARKVAGSLNINLFDNTTFETNRLMFWPSTPKDVDYYIEIMDAKWLDADDVLGQYLDWKDTSLWPTADRRFAEIRDASEKQEDPTTKRGLIGAFCRAYSISEAIQTFLSDVYVEAKDDRYTYLKGSTAAGVIVYGDLFAFSHHGTDPISGKLCNSFDLVRIHKFGHLDANDSQKEKTKKSFKAMQDFVRENGSVKQLIAAENLKNAAYEFAEEVEAIDIEWAEELEVDARGNYISSAANLNIIFANDKALKNAFKQNEFDAKRYVVKSLPWRKIDGWEVIKNVDYSGIRNYLESVYGIVGNLKIDDSLALEFQKQSFHPVRDYLSKLKWDKVRRVDYLLVDYFGVEENTYSREAIRKMLVGAVARIFNPGAKFDLVLTLVGPQGTGKSTFVSKLGKDWFSDTFMTVQGKEALEQIQGAWLIEMAELSGLRKAEVEATKHFISKREDTFRPAYARTSETYKRQCVFIGTTNKKDFLSDPSGNRRFMPIDIQAYNAKKSVFKHLDDEVDQIWAEAVVLFKKGELLYLSKEAENIALAEQRSHSEVDERQGLIEEYLTKKLPKEWAKFDVYERRTFIDDELSPEGAIERDHVCIAEIWCECLGKEKEDMTRYNTRELNDIMRGLDGWEASRSTKNFPLYGKQKYYTRLLV